MGRPPVLGRHPIGEGNQTAKIFAHRAHVGFRMRASLTRNTPRSSEQETEAGFASEEFVASNVDECSGKRRVVISRLEPAIEGGHFAVKRIIGDEVKICALIFADGHDVLSAVVKYRHANETQWTEGPLVEKPNDVWVGNFFVRRLGTYFYTVEAWVDEFGTWSRNLAKKLEAGMDVGTELKEGAALISRLREKDEFLEGLAAQLRSKSRSQREKVELARDPEVARQMEQRSQRAYATLLEPELEIRVDPRLARFGAWYEMFPVRCCLPRAHPPDRNFVSQRPEWQPGGGPRWPGQSMGNW